MGSSSGGTRCRTGQPWSSLADGVLASSIAQQERGVPVRSLSLRATRIQSRPLCPDDLIQPRRFSKAWLLNTITGLSFHSLVPLM